MLQAPAPPRELSGQSRLPACTSAHQHPCTTSSTHATKACRKLIMRALTRQSSLSTRHPRARSSVVTLPHCHMQSASACRSRRSLPTTQRAAVGQGTASEAGAQASANIYSLLITAKANGIDPLAYLTKVVRELPKASSDEDYEALLPFKNQS